MHSTWLGLRQQLDLCSVPQFFRHDALVQAVHQQIILLWNLMVFVSGAMNLFEFAAAKGNLSAVDGIFQNGPNQCCAEKGRDAILTGKFLKTVGLQIFGQTICARVRVDVLLKNRAYKNLTKQLFLVCFLFQKLNGIQIILFHIAERFSLIFPNRSFRLRQLLQILQQLHLVQAHPLQRCF